MDEDVAARQAVACRDGIRSLESGISKIRILPDAWVSRAGGAGSTDGSGDENTGFPNYGLPPCIAGAGVRDVQEGLAVNPENPNFTPADRHIGFA